MTHEQGKTKPATPRVLMVSGELYPLAKTGGLADVCAALPAALSRLGVDARVVLPAYPSALEAAESLRVVAEFNHPAAPGGVRVLAGCSPGNGQPLCLVDAPGLYDRPGSPYTSPEGHDWPDNARRFALLGIVAARIATGLPGLGWKPDLLHGHDWHAGMAHALLAASGSRRIPSLFTIHNLAYQGNMPLPALQGLGLPPELLTGAQAEFYGQWSFMKAGIECADRISTVSRRYAQEICEPEFGFGMDGVIRRRRQVLDGVMNGIDTQLWNPALDPRIAAPYQVGALEGKAACKVDLQARCGFPIDLARPLAVFVSRLDWQKMVDVMLELFPALLAEQPDLQIAILGRGDRRYEQDYAALAAAHPERLWFSNEYNEDCAHRLLAGGDLLLHGSRYEPCGLTQQYAMRYGTLPVARRTGGLTDSIVDAGSCEGHSATGFLFDAVSGEAMRQSIDRALGCYRNEPAYWRRMVTQAMRRDASWEAAAKRYLEIYLGLCPPALPREEQRSERLIRNPA